MDKLGEEMKNFFNVKIERRLVSYEEKDEEKFDDR